MIGELLGVPASDRGMLREWFQTLLAPWAGDPPPEAVAASAGIVGYFEDLVDAKRQAPGDDLVERPSGRRERTPQPAQHAKAVPPSSLFQLIVAGHDTTTSLIGNGVVALLDNPDQLSHVASRHEQDPLTPSRSSWRFTAPVPHATFRVTSETVTVGGVDIPRPPPGAGVPRRGTVIPALSRCGSPRHRSSETIPPRFRARHPLLPRRTAGPSGGTRPFSALLGRFPHIRLAVPRADLAWTHGDGLVLRGLGSLPVTLGPSNLLDQ